jgi:hypothetical protein
LLDEEGRVLAYKRCYIRNAYYDPDAPFHEYSEVIPWDPRVRAIAFLRDEAEIHRLEIEEEAPVARGLARDRVARDRERVSWDVEPPRDDAPTTYYALRYSNDGGNTWRAVTLPSTEPSHDLDLARLPGGEDCRLQLIASTGVRTTTTETEPFAVPRKPREAFVLAPDPGATFTQGEPVLLMGSGFSPDFETPDFEEMVWRSDVDGPLGIGYQILAQTLSKGHHRIILTIPDGLGGEVSTGVDILVTGVGVV